MDRKLPIPLFNLYPTDSTRLLVLKSQFNRHATKLNSLVRYLSEQEKEEIVVILTYLDRQIQAYEGQGYSSKRYDIFI